MRSSSEGLRSTPRPASRCRPQGVHAGEGLIEPLPKPLGQMPVRTIRLKECALGLDGQPFCTSKLILPGSLKAFVLTELLVDGLLDGVGSDWSERLEDQPLYHRVHARRADGAVGSVVPS